MTSSQSSTSVQIFLAFAAVIAATLTYKSTTAKRHQKKKRQTQSIDFDEPVDRTSIFTVKYDLRSILFGPKAQSATPLWVADMDLPISYNIRERIMTRASHPCGIGYTIQPVEAWEAVVQWLQRRFNWTVDVSQITYSAGVITSAANVIRAFTSPGDSVLCMTPLFLPLQNAVSGTGRRLIRHQLQLTESTTNNSGRKNMRYEIDFLKLEKQIVSEDIKIVILCNPHNPSGRVWSRAELQSLLFLCATHNVLILSDEIWCDWLLSWSKDVHTPISSLPRANEICITLMGPTKTWNVAGMQCSFVTIQNEHLQRKYLNYVEPAHLHYGDAFSTESLLATYGDASNAMNGNSNSEQWLEEAKKYVEGNIEMVTNYIEQNIPQLKVIPSDATYLVWIDCSGLDVSGNDDNDDAVKNAHSLFLEKAQVILSPGSEFSPDTDHFVRMNVACSRKILRGALERISTVVQMQNK